MAKNGNTDTDMGFKDILKEIDKFKDMRVKVGLPDDGEEHEGVRIAQYAYWNEVGVMDKDNSDWYIPPRPFIRTTVDTKLDKIQQAIDSHYGLIVKGKTEAKAAASAVGDAVVSLIKETIRNGPWKENSPITIHGSDAVVVGKETKVSKKTGKSYTKTIKKKFIKGKKSTKPLIDTGTMKNSIQYVVEQNGVEVARGK
jgi:hypothetical protein